MPGPQIFSSQSQSRFEFLEVVCTFCSNMPLTWSDCWRERTSDCPAGMPGTLELKPRATFLARSTPGAPHLACTQAGIVATVDARTGKAMHTPRIVLLFATYARKLLLDRIPPPARSSSSAEEASSVARVRCDDATTTTCTQSKTQAVFTGRRQSRARGLQSADWYESLPCAAVSRIPLSFPTKKKQEKIHNGRRDSSQSEPRKKMLPSEIACTWYMLVDRSS